MPVIPVQPVPGGQVRGLSQVTDRPVQSQAGGFIADAAGKVASAAQAADAAFARGEEERRKEREKVDASLVMEAEHRFDSARAALQTEFSGLEGDNAAKLSGDYLKRLKEERERARDLLTGDEVRQVFDQRTAGSLLSTQTWVNNRVASESDRTRKIRAKAVVEGKAQLVEQTWDDDAVAARETALAAQAAQAEAAIEGLPSEAADVAVRAQVGEIHERRMAAAVASGDGARAEAALRSSEPHLGARGAYWQKQIDAMKRGAEVEARGRAMLEESRLEGSEWFDPEIAGRMVEELPAEDPRKPELRAWVEAQALKQDRFKARRGGELFDELDGLVLEGADLSDPRVQARVERLKDPALGMTRELRAWLASMERTNKPRSSVGGANARRQQKDLDDLAEATFLALDPDDQRAEGFVGDSVALDEMRELFRGASPTMRKKIIAKQKGMIRDESGEGDARFNDARTSLEKALDGLKRSKADKVKALAALRTWWDERGGKVTRNDALAKIADLVELKDKSGAWHSGYLSRSRFGFEIDPEDAGDYQPRPAAEQPSALARGLQEVDIAPLPVRRRTAVESADEIPASARSFIEEQWRGSARGRRGQRMTPADLVQGYNALLSRGAFR